MVDTQRRRLKEIRTLRGWREAYRTAGLPDDGASANTQQKRLSRLINRDTGGFKNLDQNQQRRISREYRKESTQEALKAGRGKAAVREVQKQRRANRKEANRQFGEDGLFPDQAKLQRRLQQNRGLTAAERRRLEDSFTNAETTEQWKAARAGYATAVRKVSLAGMSGTERRKWKQKVAKATNAQIRDEA
jgi:hypothetical protein